MPFPLIVLSRTEEPKKAGTCARDRRALQQLALIEPNPEKFHILKIYNYITGILAD